MRVLVVGGLGYVGQEVVKELRNRGFEPMVCDVGWFTEAIIDPRGSAQADFYDFRSLRVEDLTSFDAVIHLAAYSNDPLGWLSEASTLGLNFQSTVEFADLAKSAGVGTFVFSSSCSVYGASGVDFLDETGPTNPLTPYASSKLAAEKRLRKLAGPNFRVRILRGATAFGPSLSPRTDLLLNELCAHAAVGRVMKLTSNGKSWRPFMPISDFARALVCAAAQPPRSGETYGLWNIAPPDMRMTVMEAASRAAEIAGVAAPICEQGLAVDDRSYKIDGSKFASDYPSFSYCTDFAAIVRDTVDCFSQIPTLEEDLERKRFIRLSALERRAALAAG